MNGVAHGLGRTSQTARDLSRAVSGRAGQEDLGAAERDGARRPQARLELSPFRVAQVTNKDGWMHPGQMSSSPPSHKGSLEPALALPWQFTGLTQAEAGPAHGTSQAHGLGELIEQGATDLRKARLRRGALRLFSPAGRPQAAALARSRTPAASSAHVDAAPANHGPRSGRAPTLPSAADAPARTPSAP